MFVDDRRKAARGQDVGFLIELGGRTQLGEPLPVVGEQIGLELGPVAGLSVLSTLLSPLEKEKALAVAERMTWQAWICAMITRSSRTSPVGSG